MPRTVDHAKRRVELIAAGWKLIARDGLEMATMRRVAAEAGCTTGMLTHYFADRQSLLVGALRGAHERAAARMISAAVDAESDFDRLERVVMESLPLDDVRTQEWRIWLAFWGASMSNPDLAAENQARYVEWRSTVSALLSEIFADDADAQNECNLLIAMIDGLGIWVARQAGTDGAALNSKQQQCSDTIAYYLTQLSARAT